MSEEAAPSTRVDDDAHRVVDVAIRTLERVVGVEGGVKRTLQRAVNVVDDNGNYGEKRTTVIRSVIGVAITMRMITSRRG